VKDLWMHGVASLNFHTMNMKTKKVVSLAIVNLLNQYSGNPDIINAILIATQTMTCTTREIAAVIHDDAKSFGDDHGSFEVSYAKLSSTISPKYDSDFFPQITHIDPVTALKSTLKTIPSVPPQLGAWASVA
jgi:hypothetical protein